MTARPLFRAAFALATVLSLLSGCGSSSSLELFPQVEFTVEGQPGRSTWEFSPDTTRGQLTQQAAVLVLNSGEGQLDISEVKFETENPFLKLIYPKGKPSFPVALGSNDRLNLTVRFQPDPNIENNESATLTVKHNDDDKPDIVITFSIDLQGPKVVLKQKTAQFINPSAANPPSICIGFTNGGNAPLVFNSAYMETATKYYSIIEQPNSGTSIAAKGQGDNPKNNPKYLNVCVRVSPDDKSGDYGAKLVIETNDKTNPYAKVTFSVTWEEDNVFKVTCGTPDGSLKYDFTGTASGIVEKCCNIYNEGPSGMLINKVEVNPLDLSKQDLADSLYGVKLYKKLPDGTKDKVSLPRSINPSKSLDFCVEYIFPNDNKTTNAEMVVNYSQANIPSTLQLPVIAGACDTPDLLVSPAATPIWLQTKLGGKATKELVIANQSCAPLQLLQACVTQVAARGSDSNPCGNATLLSAHFDVVKDTGLTQIKPWELLSLAVKFEPPNEKYKTINHFLNIVYCPGAWKGDKCAEQVVARTVNLTGTVDSDESKLYKVPTLKLGAYNDQEPKVGQPFKIEAIATEGDLPIGQYGAYLWTIKTRPAGSTLWVSNDFQSTDVPYLTINPDFPGTYVVVGQVQAVDDTNPSKLAWSEQVEFTFEVK